MPAIEYWVWLSGLHSLRPKAKNLLISHFGSPAAVYFADEREYEQVSGLTEKDRAELKSKDLSYAGRVIDKCRAVSVQILTMQDAAYPERLLNIYDPPVALYIKGSMPALDAEAAITIAGTRKATPYGLKMAKRFGYELAKGGALVVSGLTAGVDSAAAEGALMAGGPVVGILCTAINNVYPSWNGRLFDDVAAAGALVSEYPPDAGQRTEFFRERNRILSGVSAGLVVIEAPRNSGALLTANLAQEQGRDIFSVPGNADAGNSFGTNALIKECAKAVTSGWDVLCEYAALYPGKIKMPDTVREDEQLSAIAQSGARGAPPTESGKGFLKFRARNKARPEKKKEDDGAPESEVLRKQLEGLSENQLKIISAITKPSTHIDEIIDTTQLPASLVLAELTMLQISGVVNQEKGKRFTVNLMKRG